MPSEIELALYDEWAGRVSSDGDVGDHCLLELCISRDIASDTDVLRLAVCPNDREYMDRSVATFRNIHFGRIQQTEYDPEFNDLPWPIAGFHSTSLDADRWSFQLNCHGLRIQWSSLWPEIERDS